MLHRGEWGKIGHQIAFFIYFLNIFLCITAKNWLTKRQKHALKNAAKDCIKILFVEFSQLKYEIFVLYKKSQENLAWLIWLSLLYIFPSHFLIFGKKRSQFSYNRLTFRFISNQDSQIHRINRTTKKTLVNPPKYDLPDYGEAQGTSIMLGIDRRNQERLTLSVDDSIVLRNHMNKDIGSLQ